MNISNPKTTVGGLPLATTWYVNTRFQGTKKYIDAVSAFLSGYTDTEVAAATNAAIERENLISSSLSATSDMNDAEIISAFCRYITGSGTDGVPSEFVTKFLPTGTSEDPSVYYVPKEYGYAYLGPDKKIANELMPDITLMDISVVDVTEIYDFLKAKGDLDSNKELYTAAAAAGKDVKKLTAVVKDVISKYVMENQTAHDSKMRIFSQGDIIVVTYYDDVNKSFAQKLATEVPAMADVFSQSFIAGGWICSAEAREDRVDANNVPFKANTSIAFTKLSFNQGEIISVNNLIPDVKGNVAINLSEVLLLDSNNADGLPIGEVLARDIQQVRTTTSDTTAMENVTLTGLIELSNFGQRFVYNDRTRGAGYAYATINEVASLNIKTKEVTDIISAALDTEVARAKADEAAISAALDAEVTRSTDYDTYLSGVIGDEAALTGATVTEALVALKNHTEVTATTAEANFNKLAAEINTEAYDVLDVYTVVIDAAAVKDIDMSAEGISVSAMAYTDKYTIEGYNDLYEANVYNYFGFKATEAGNDIAEIVIGGFTGRILDIYAFDADKGAYEKIDADIRYKEVVYDNTVPGVIAEFALLGEYKKAAGETAAHTKLDKLVVRYTKKHTYEPAAFDVNLLFK